MSALHEAARLVVSAWVSTRPAWIEQCNAAVLALDAALKAQPQDTELSAALGWPGGISNPVLDRKVLLQKVAALMQDKLWEDHRVRHLWDHTMAHQPEPAQGPVAAAFSAAFGAEQHPTDDRVVIERRGETLYLNGQKIGPGTLEIRRDGVTYRAAERVAVQTKPAQQADPTDPGHDIDVLREHVRHLERRVRELHAQQAKPAQEPVAVFDERMGQPVLLPGAPMLKDEQPLYTAAQPQRPPLTDEEIVDAVREADLDWQGGWTLDEHEPNRFTTLARAIERKVRGEA